MTEYELFDKLRMRTGMYTGFVSPTHLRAFMCGFFYAIDAETTDVTKEETPPFNEFNDWVADRLGYNESTLGWADMIEKVYTDKKLALDQFYELLDEYRRIKHKHVAKIYINHDNSKISTLAGDINSLPTSCNLSENYSIIPNQIIIRELTTNEGWYQMLVVSANKQLLYTWSSQELIKVYSRAEEMFFITREQWTVEE